MGAIDRITERLRHRHGLVYRVAGATVTVEPSTPDGFPVSLTVGADEWIVAFGGWHVHFTSEDEALNCFAFGLSDQCRLRVHYRGSFPHRWIVEARTENGWREDSTTGLLLFPFWRRPRVEYRQNGVITEGKRDAASDSSRG